MDLAASLTTPSRTPATRPRVAGVLAVVAGCAIALGAFLPWLSVFGGLERISGMTGINGKILAGFGVSAIVMGALLAVQAGAIWRVGISGLAIASSVFVGYLIAQLLSTVRQADSMVFPGLQPGLFVCAGGSLLLLSSLVVAGKGKVVMSRAIASPITNRRLVVQVVAFVTAGAGLIHFAAAPDHFREFVPFGILFVVAGAMQVGWAVLTDEHVSVGALEAFILLNAVVVAAWIFSRTAGLPMGPMPWMAEPAGFADIAATLFEVVAIVGGIWLLGERERTLRGSVVKVTRWAIASVVAAVTLVAVMSASGLLGHASTMQM